MKSNSTVPQDNDGWESLWIWIVYIIEGAGVGGVNLLIVLVVLRFKALRAEKEYLVVMSLSLADAINMMAYAIAGIRRTYLLFAGEYNSPKSPWECETTLHNLIWSFSDQLSGLILLIVSIDRLLSVTLPFRYIMWSRLYILLLFGGTYVYTFVAGTITSLILVHEMSDLNITLPAHCTAGLLGRMGYNQFYYAYRKFAAALFALMSITVYGVLWILYKHQQNQIVPGQINDENQEKQQLARQREFTRSLGISCLCTLFVFIIPFSLVFILSSTLPRYINILFFFVSNLNPLCNIFIYYHRLPEMRQAFIAFFSCKTMPSHVEVWKANNEARNIRSRQLSSTTGK